LLKNQGADRASFMTLNEVQEEKKRLLGQGRGSVETRSARGGGDETKGRGTEVLQCRLRLLGVNIKDQNKQDANHFGNIATGGSEGGRRSLNIRWERNCFGYNRGKGGATWGQKIKEL